MNRFKLSGWALLGGVLSLLTGAPPEAIATQREDASEATESAVDASDPTPGFGIEGDGFYVWDEDRREAEDWAIELAGPAFPPRRS